MSDDLRAFEHWTPAAQEKALEALRLRTQRKWRAFWCGKPGCDGNAHGKWTWNHARQDQHPPGDRDWLTWLLLSGRGTGKTRTGAEYTHRVTKNVPRVAIIGGTKADLRDIMVEGESGLVTIAAPEHRPLYEPSKRRLTWPNGCVGTLFSAEEPDRLRGPEHYYAWWDEPAHAPLVSDAWDNLMFGLRLGAHPRVVCTTTPRPKPWLKELVADATTRVAKASTYDNLGNLAPAFATRIITKYEGTRLGRQELHGEILEDVEGALWNWDLIDVNRIPEHPELVRTVIAIDPAGSSRTSAAETAIVAAGRDPQGHLHLLADRSGHYSPLGWATAVINAYDDLDADAVIAETNFGGEMVASQLRLSGFTGRLITIHAKRGKDVRAEPVVGLYEQGLVHHVGEFPELETQMCEWVPYTGMDSPDRLDAAVYALTALATQRAVASISSPVRAHLQEHGLEAIPLVG